jgi:hypothetical protein
MIDMRKLRSVVALASVALVMACQTAVASTSALRDSQVAPVTATQYSSTHAAASPTAATSSHKKTWIILGVAAAIVAIVLVVSVSHSSDSVY